MERRYQLETSDFVELELAGYVTTPVKWLGTSHAHPFWELILIADGNGEYLLPDSDPVAVAESTMMLIKPDTQHKFRNLSSKEANILYVGFICGKNENTGRVPPIQKIAPPDTRLLSVASELSGAYPDSRRKLLNRFRSTFFRIVSDLAVDLLHLKPNDPSEYGNRQALLVEKVKSYLAKRRDQSIDVSLVGDAFYLSSHYLADLFKKQTGMSPKQFHHGLRMREADRLLTEEKLSVTETAERLGFDSIHYFSRRFREFYGYSPSQRLNPDAKSTRPTGTGRADGRRRRKREAR